MNTLLWAHIAGGTLALLSGAAAVMAGKGGPLHIRAGSCFVASMLLLGITAAILAWLQAQLGLAAGGVLACYFVSTSWVAARRRDGATGKFEMAACAVAFGAAAAMLWAGLAADAPPTPAGRSPIFAVAGVCLLAGLLDLNAILRAPLTRLQRISRHLWRMCFAFFLATGSFFLGQQSVMPPGIRGSPFLFVLAFAPLAAMAFWLVRVRLGKPFGRRRLGKA